MPNSYVEITSNGSASQALAFSFPYLNQTDIGVTVDGVTQNLTTHWSFATTQSIVFVSHPANGAVIRISRTTPSATRVVDFQDGSVLSEADLDNSADQIFFIAQEAADTAAQSIILDTDGKWEAQSKPIKNVTNPTNAQDAVTKNYLENTWLSTSDKTQLNNLNTTNLNTVAGSVSNVNTVAGAITNVNTVAGKSTEIGLLGTSDAVADMNTLGTSAIVEDLNLLGTTANVAAMATLGTSANVTNMATLGASGVVADIATVAGVASTMSAAATNATNAASSASAASGSATAAANSAAAAAASFDTFDDRYLGSKSSEPSVDNDGNALVSGSLFFDSAVGSMKVYDGGNWILATSAGAVSLLDYEYTATAGQTTFSGSDNNSATLSYSAGNLIVSLNGIILDNGSDYTATSGTSIVLASGAAAGDHLAVVAFKSFTASDTVAASTGGTFAGGVTVSGTLTATAAQVNGNIAVTGTVDGRDVAADGTKLDTNIPASLGTAGQVLTVNAGATAGAWVDASGGGEQTFTATGAISAGDLVGFNSNGTISVSEAELQAAVAIGSGSDSNVALVYDTANDKVLMFFHGTSNYLYGRVGTIANGQISFGSVTSTSYVASYIDAAYDVNSGKTVVVYTQSGGNNYPYAIVATVSGTTLSFGTPVSMKSSAQYNTIVEYDSNAQKVLCVYNGYSYTKVLGRVGTVSGTSISFGTEAQLSTNNVIRQSSALSFDSTANKFILSFIELNGNVPKIKTCTISGTSVSGGTEISGSGGLASGSFTPELTYIPSINKTILISTYSSYAYYYILTISGTDVTATSAVRYDTTLGSNGGRGYLISAGDKQYIQYWQDAGDYNTLIEVSVSATEISFAPLSKKVQWSSSATGAMTAIYDSDTGNIVNADATSVCLFNITAPSFVGIAAENISNGATGKVTVAGGINTSVSGLTAGKTYGLPPSSASISEIGVSGEKAFGVALSSSSIYLNVGKL